MAVLKHTFKKEIKRTMKYVILYCIPPLFAWHACSVQNSSSLQKAETKFTPNDTINFSSQVQPILVGHCSPCHFPGGKMYQRMPFDKDTTIINHEAGVLRRIKGDDNLLIRNFILQNKNGLSADKPFQ